MADKPAPVHRPLLLELYPEPLPPAGFAAALVAAAAGVRSLWYDEAAMLRAQQPFPEADISGFLRCRAVSEPCL